MSLDLDFEYENFQQYYGDEKQVKKIINECPACGGEVCHSHVSDYTNLCIQEDSRCMDCGHTKTKQMHVIN